MCAFPIRTPPAPPPTPVCLCCGKRVRGRYRRGMPQPLCKACDSAFTRRRLGIPPDPPRLKEARKTSSFDENGRGDPPAPPWPTATTPGTPARVGVYEARRAARLGLYHEHDRPADAADLPPAREDGDGERDTEKATDIDRWFAARLPRRWDEREE